MAPARQERASVTRVRVGVIFSLFAGLLISIALIVYYSLPGIVAALWTIGWRLSIIVLVHVAAVVLCGLAWGPLLLSETRARLKILISLRWVRESVNTLLPVARVGGDIVGGRLLAIHGIKPNVVAASIVADRTAELLSLFFFSAAGVISLLGRATDHEVAHWAILGLIVLFLFFTAFFLALRAGLLRIIESLILKVLRRWKEAPVAEKGSIEGALWTIFRDGRRFSRSTFLHVLAWLTGVVQIHLAMNFMSRPIGWAEAFIVESLSQIICTAAFIMPAALGAQEAGYMVLGTLMGIPPELGLALSLVKRVGDVAVGIPGLLFWQCLEGRRLWALWTAGRGNETLVANRKKG